MNSKSEPVDSVPPLSAVDAPAERPATSSQDSAETSWLPTRNTLGVGFASVPIPFSDRDTNVIPEMPLATRVVRGSFVVALASYATILIGFAATIIMTRLVAPRDFGTMSLATSLFGLMNLRTKVGWSQAFARHPETSGRSIGTLFTLDVGAGVASLLLALLVVPLLGVLGYPEDVRWVVLALGVLGSFEAIASVPALLLDKGLFFGRTSLVTALSLGLSYLPAFLLALNGFGVWSLVAQAAIQMLLVVIGYWWLARRSLREPWRVRWRFDRTLAREFIRFGLIWGSAAIAGSLTTQFDNLLVGTIVGVEILGYYDRAYRLALWPSLLVTAVVSRTTFFAYARLQQDAVRLSKTFDMSLWIITTLALPLALVIFITAPDLIQVLFGERWLPAAPLLRFLVISSLIRPLLDDIGGLFTAIGQPHLVSRVNWSMAVIVIVVAGILTIKLGAIGTAIGVGIALLVGALLFYRWVARVVQIIWAQALGLPLAVTILTFTGYWLVSRWIAWNDFSTLYRLGLKTSFALALFYLLLIVIQPRLFFGRVRYVWRLMRGYHKLCNKMKPQSDW